MSHAKSHGVGSNAKKKFVSSPQRLINVTIANREAMGQLNYYVKQNNITDVVEKQLRYVIQKSGRLLQAVAILYYNK